MVRKGVDIMFDLIQFESFLRINLSLDMIPEVRLITKDKIVEYNATNDNFNRVLNKIRDFAEEEDFIKVVEEKDLSSIYAELTNDKKIRIVIV